VGESRPSEADAPRALYPDERTKLERLRKAIAEV
jgi:hypothetical protein